MYRRVHEPAARERQAVVERGAPAIVVRDLMKRYGGVLLGWTAASFFAAVAFFHLGAGASAPIAHPTRMAVAEGAMDVADTST